MSDGAQKAHAKVAKEVDGAIKEIGAMVRHIPQRSDDKVPLIIMFAERRDREISSRADILVQEVSPRGDPPASC